MTEKVVPEGKYADVGDGLQMHYQDVGTGTKGTLLFIHGSGPGASGYSNFKGNYPFLVEQGYRCLVIDTLGFGYSSKPEEFDYSLPSLAARTKKLVDQAGVTKIIALTHPGYKRDQEFAAPCWA